MCAMWSPSRERFAMLLLLLLKSAGFGHLLKAKRRRTQL